MPARIEEARDDEVGELARLARVIWTETYPPLIGRPQTEYMLERFQSEAAIAEQRRGGFRYFLLRDADGTAAGYFAVAPAADHLFLSKLYVAAEFRGRGLARLALDQARALAQGLGLGRIELTVNRRNAAAIAAYRRLGFAVAGELVTEIGAGYVMDDFRMEWVWA